MLVLALLLALSLSACGSQPGTATPPTGSGGENDSASPTHASHDTTYWTAVRYESYNPSFGRTEVSAMPTEKWWADLYLNEDGTALFREALGFGYPVLHGKAPAERGRHHAGVDHGYGAV